MVRKIVIDNPTGLHLDLQEHSVKAAIQFESKIWLKLENYKNEM